MNPMTTTPNGVHPAADAAVLTLAEAAEFLRVSEAGLKQDADAGRLPGRLVAGEWRFVRAALVNWLSNVTVPGRSGVDGGDQVPEVIRKAVPAPRDLNKGLLDSIGAFADDPMLESMVEQIYRDRKRNTVGG